MTGGPTYSFGLKIYTLGIFWVKRTVTYIFMSKFAFTFSLQSLNYIVKQVSNVNQHTRFKNIYCLMSSALNTVIEQSEFSLRTSSPLKSESKIVVHICLPFYLLQKCSKPVLTKY